MPKILKILFIWNKLYWNANPTNVPTIISVEIIIAVSFLSPFLFNNTRIPKPPDVHKPASKEPKLIVFLTNKTVSITEIAQLGINPISDTKNGCKGEFIKQYFAIFSSVPALDRRKPSTKETISIKINILTVCFSGCNQKSFVFAASAS